MIYIARSLTASPRGACLNHEKKKSRHDNREPLAPVFPLLHPSATDSGATHKRQTTQPDSNLCRATTTTRRDAEHPCPAAPPVQPPAPDNLSIGQRPRIGLTQGGGRRAWASRRGGGSGDQQGDIVRSPRSTTIPPIPPPPPPTATTSGERAPRNNRACLAFLSPGVSPRARS